MPFRLLQVGRGGGGEGQRWGLAVGLNKSLIQLLRGQLQAVLSSHFGIELADAAAQADQGAHRIKKQGLGGGHRCRGVAVHSANQSAATFRGRLWPGRRVR